MRRGWMRCAAIVAFGALVSVGSAPVAMAAPVGASGLGPRGRSARAAGILQPRGGDWEGSGPHGLRMSFELAGAGRSARLRYLAVSLPSGCRVGAAPSFSRDLLRAYLLLPADALPRGDPRRRV